MMKRIILTTVCILTAILSVSCQKNTYYSVEDIAGVWEGDGKGYEFFSDKTFCPYSIDDKGIWTPMEGSAHTFNIETNQLGMSWLDLSGKIRFSSFYINSIEEGKLCWEYQRNGKLIKETLKKSRIKKNDQS